MRPKARLGRVASACLAGALTGRRQAGHAHQRHRFARGLDADLPRGGRTWNQGEAVDGLLGRRWSVLCRTMRVTHFVAFFSTRWSIAFSKFGIASFWAVLMI